MSKKSKYNKTKILFYGDSPNLWTGFAQVLYNIIIELHKTKKYEIDVFGIHEPVRLNEYGLLTRKGNKLPESIKVIPGLYKGNVESDPHNVALFLDYFKNNHYDILFILNDPYVCNKVSKLLKEMKLEGKQFKTIYYFPVDSEFTHSLWFQTANEFDYPVVYTKFGYELSQEKYPELQKKLKIIYHGTNIKDFYPLSDDIIKKYRKQFFERWIGDNEDDLFVLLNLNRNQGRKDTGRTLLVFSEFLKLLEEKDRDKCKLLMHMNANDFMGTNIVKQIEYLDMNIKDKVVICGDYRGWDGNPIESLNIMYNIADAGITTTTGEGWGLFNTECMATKTLLFAPENTVHPEILDNGNRGVLIKNGQIRFGYTNMYRNDHPRYMCDEIDFANKLKEYFYNRNDEKYKKIRKNGLNFVQSITWEKIVKNEWLPIFQQAEKELIEEKRINK